jgi:hypothetical protein
MIYTLNVCLELLQSHSKVQSHDDWSMANATSPTGFRRHIRVSWNCMWLKVRVSSLSLIRLHEGGKLVKFDSGRNDNLSKAFGKVCFILLNSCEF